LNHGEEATIGVWKNNWLRWKAYDNGWRNGNGTVKILGSAKAAGRAIFVADLAINLGEWFNPHSADPQRARWHLGFRNALRAGGCR